MWVVIQTDVYSDGASCDDARDENVVNVFGPFDVETDARRFAEGRDDFGHVFDVMKLTPARG